MSASPPYSNYFRCRTIGRAASPPAVICYEQIPYDDDDYSESCSDSCSEDDEDYPNDAADNEHNNSDSQDEEGARHPSADDPNDLDMDIDEEGAVGTESGEMQSGEPTKDIKGKQRAMDAEPEPEPPKRHHRRKQRHNTFTLRPILTIQRSQGFVWNQDLFLPPYIRERYVASASPPHSSGFISTSVSSTNSALNDYEVEVVEIRVQEGELDHIIS